MKPHFRQALIILICSPFLLLAAICDPADEVESFLIFNPMRISVSPGPDFSLGDTIWVRARVSFRAFDTAALDSVPNPEQSVNNLIQVARFQASNSIGINANEAILEFDLIPLEGSLDFLGACPTGTLIAVAPLAENGESYIYEFGLKPQNTGDFVLSWSTADPVILRNSELNVEILQQYPSNGDNNTLSIGACGTSATRNNVAETRMDYFFRVNP